MKHVKIGPSRTRRAVIALAAASALGAAGFAAASASSPGGQLYACTTADATAISCVATAVPTVTATATVTATITATPSVSATPSVTPPPPAAGTLTGTSTPGLSVFPTAKAVRSFSSGLPASSLPSVPAGAAVFLSFKTLPSDAVFAADLAAWESSGHEVYWTYYHEADSGALTPAAYQSGWSHLLAVEAAHPYASVHSLTILMAYCFQRGNCESYYVPGVDFIGFDCYQLANEQRAEAYALAKGKRMVFGEVGNVTAGSNTDSAALAYARTFWAALTPNVLAAIWWSGPPDTLVGKPATTSFLAAQ